MDIYNFNVYQGAAFSVSLIVKDDSGTPINLSGYSIYGGIKYHYSDEDVFAQFSGAVVSPESGVVSISMTPAETASLNSTQYLYGVEAHKDDGVIKLLNGYLSVHPEVII